ncbi:MAG TPA: hypothetical protein VNO43_17720 [Candidatus Eisenbacteria bacterium]|nr:hypothetical protein [Candidatus Eisenbacteria bacterium]
MPNLRHIHLHSNGLLWTEAMWRTIPEDIRVLIRSCEISIDAARSDTYAINRRGGNFSKLLANLNFISALRRDGPLEFVKISMVVQANNFREMPAFVRLGERFGFDSVYFSQLVNWGTFSDAEFRSRAVHLPAHPAHREFAQLLRSPSLKHPLVDLGNLTTIHADSTVTFRRPLSFSKRIVKAIRRRLRVKSKSQG